jgi:hypothetical protein
MTRRKGEITARMNERDFPHIVELALPSGGFGETLDEMQAFHRLRGIASARGSVSGATSRNTFGGVSRASSTPTTSPNSSAACTFNARSRTIGAPAALIQWTWPRVFPSSPPAGIRDPG